MSMPKLSWGKEKHDLAARWPKMNDGTPEKPVFLTAAAEGDSAAAMLAEKLRAYDIPVLREYGTEGALSRVLFGTPSSGVGLYVPESMLEDAQNLIAPVDEAEPEETDNYNGDCQKSVIANR